MASKAVDAFLSMMRQDPALMTEAEQILGSAPDPFAALATLAARHGFDLTADDLQAALATPDERELSSSELEKVAGGAEEEGPAGRMARLEGLETFLARASGVQR